MSGQQLFWWRLCAILVLVGCISMIFVGAALDYAVLAFGGIFLLLGAGFVSAVVMSILVIVRAVRAVKQEDELSRRGELDPVAEERQSIKRINTSYGYANQMAQGEHMLKHTIRAYQYADRSEKIKSFILLGWLLGLIIAGIVFVLIGEAYWQMRIVGFCCWGGFAGTIIICGIGVGIRQRRSRRPRADSALQRAKVVACTLSSANSFGSERTQHITSTTYKVKVELPDGTRKIAYCRQCYRVGDELMVRESHGRDLVTVVE